ncbi:hypothetical protein ACN6KF_005278 [Labrys sp. La1]|uniref:hypothetical protein n=1 Tax=Labrys sp. La1 TaxID=3404917 RepID=UPI003EB72985
MRGTVGFEIRSVTARVTLAFVLTLRKDERGRAFSNKICAMKTLLLIVGLLAAIPHSASAAANHPWRLEPEIPAFPAFTLPNALPDPPFLPAEPPSFWTSTGLANLIDYPAPMLDTHPSREPMQITVVHSSTPNCDDHCAEWISAEGMITDDTPLLFRMTLALLGKRKLPVVISSPGGSVRASFAVGQMIRIRGLDVIVGRTVKEACPEGDKACNGQSADARRGTAVGFDAICASACVYVLSGGVQRIVPPLGAQIGVHETVQTGTSVWIERSPVKDSFGRVIGFRSQMHAVANTLQQAAPPAAYVKAESYLTAMGISNELISLMHQAASNQVRFLTGKELADTGLATQRLTIDEYFATAGRHVADAVAPAMERLPSTALPLAVGANDKVPTASQDGQRSATPCPASFEALPVEGKRATGLVDAVMPPDAASVILHGVEETSHLQTQAKYFEFKRIGLRVFARGRTFAPSVLVPSGMAVKPGDIVTFITRHRDSTHRCQFVPNLAVAVRHS